MSVDESLLCSFQVNITTTTSPVSHLSLAMIRIVRTDKKNNCCKIHRQILREGSALEAGKK